jgi:AraC-like DNA-binding protein
MIGEFVCPSDDPRFADSGPIENHVLVVPFQPVEIHFSRARSIVADRTRVLFYNRGTCYRRKALNQLGDRCLWVTFDDGILEAYCGNRNKQPFGKQVDPLPLKLYLDVRNLYLRLTSGRADPLQVEVAAMEMLVQLVGSPVREQHSSTRRQRQTVAAADAHLARNYTKTLHLDDVAEAAACSPFHLSRLFRRLRGIGLHQHLLQLRLRDAVDRLEENNDTLTNIAMNLGFSSPSHFSNCFRNSFGVSPHRFRRARKRIRAIS